MAGWDHGLPVVALVDMDAWYADQEHAPAYLVRWDYRSGTLTPLATLPLGHVSWGAGL